MIMSFEGYQEALESQKEKEDKITAIEKTLEMQSSQLKVLIASLGKMQDQKQFDNMAQTLYNSGILKNNQANNDQNF